MKKTKRGRSCDPPPPAKSGEGGRVGQYDPAHGEANSCSESLNPLPPHLCLNPSVVNFGGRVVLERTHLRMARRERVLY